ncbi:hypothetical protein BK788_29910 [Bacillus thuringiensis serovar sinensis]|nr:PDZ domain-containing protein [Bacillus wiedmannii]OUB79410.1 hypothetical protein BK788_29910 [Bacillus thuringiensis serovar sinensis]
MIHDVEELHNLLKFIASFLFTHKFITLYSNGAVLGNISNQSPAEKGGLQQYDVVIALDEQKVENVVQFCKYLYEKKKLRDTIKVTVYRNGEKLTKNVKLTDQTRAA